MNDKLLQVRELNVNGERPVLRGQRFDSVSDQGVLRARRHLHSLVLHQRLYPRVLVHHNDLRHRPMLGEDLVHKVHRYNVQKKVPHSAVHRVHKRDKQNLVPLVRR